MINIINVEIHCNDQRMVTSMEIKLKSINPDGQENNDPMLITTASAAFSRTTLYEDVGKSIKIEKDKKRNNIVDIFIDLDENSLSTHDISNFLDAFQRELDNFQLTI